MPEAEPPTSSSLSSSKSKTANPINQIPPRSKHPVKSLFNEHDNDWPTVDLGNLITDLDADINQTSSPKMSVNNNSVGCSSSGNSGSPKPNVNTGGGSKIIPLVPSKITGPPKQMISSTSTNIGTCLSSGSATATITESRSILDGGNEKGLKMKIKRNKTSISHGNTICNSSSSTSTITSSSSPVPKTGISDSNNTVVVSGAASSGSNNPVVKPEIKTSTSPDPMMANNNGDGKTISTQPLAKLTHPGTSISSPLTNNTKQTLNGDNCSMSSSPSEGALSQASNNCLSQKSFLKIDASVGTEIGTMTEPDCLGPLDPGTSVTLEGIVWHETEGVLVINVTWRGKTYVGTLLDSTQHVNQWAPPRYSESPTAEIDNKKGRGNKRAGRPGSEPELTRKNLRSSKGKPLKSATNSPSKRKKGIKDEDSNDSLSSTLKRQRTSSKNNSADENEDGVDSEKEINSKEMDTPVSNNKENKDKETAATSTAAAEEEMTPKDPKEEKYIPPPPLPYALTCPSPGCKKRYRQHNGLRFHISHSHKELLDSKGEIRDTSDIEKCEKEAKERLRKRGIILEEEKQDNDSSSDSTPCLSNPGQDNITELNGKEDLLKNSESKSSTDLTPMETEPAIGTPTGVPTSDPSSLLKQGKPLSSVRPIVMPNNQGSDLVGVKESQNGRNGDHCPALTKDESVLHSTQIQSSDESSKKDDKLPNTTLTEGSTSLIDTAVESSSNSLVKSPAYSDISDDGGEDEAKKNSDLKVKNKPSTPISSSLPHLNEPVSTSVQTPTIQSSPAPVSSSNNHFPFAPYIPSTTSASITTTTSSSFKPEVSTSSKTSTLPPIPGTSEYQKMLQAYGFPQFPPYPPGIDPNLHLHMMNSDPSYKAKFEKDKPLKDHLEREQKEKDRRRSVGITPPPASISSGCKAPEDLRKPSTAPLPSPRSMISVKPEFNVPKSEPGRKTPQTSKDEGAKPTMETRGPPPASINPYGYLHPSLMRPPVGLSYEALAAAAASGSINPLLLSPNPYMPNPYLPPHLPPSMRPPYGGAPDLLRGSYPQGPEDLSRSVSVGPPSGGSNSSVGHVGGPSGPPPPPPPPPHSSSNNPSSSSTKALDLLQQHASQYYSNSHKIHELSDRGMKSPSEKGGSKDSSISRKRTPSPASASLSGVNRSRSPPPLRHVHTHTHTHFGLGYPLLHPPGGVPPPAAHTPFTPGAYPSHLLPPSGSKGSLPSGPLGQSFPPPPK